MADTSTSNGAAQGTKPSQDATRGLVCGSCGHPRLKVVYTRPGPGGRIVRRRECRRCGARITTWELMIGQVQMCNDSSQDSAEGIGRRDEETAQP